MKQIQWVYDLYTEDCPGMKKLVTQYFDGFSLFKGVGVWKGAEERCVLVRIIGSEQDKERVQELRKAIKAEMHQEEVLFLYHVETMIGGE